jgi:hypothetical protein
MRPQWITAPIFFLAVTLGSGTHVADEWELGGLMAYGGNLAVKGTTTIVQPREPVCQ